MLQLYLDASGNSADQPVVVVAGWLATSDIWNQFDSLWRNFLKRHNLARFHATDYWARRRPYSRMADKEYATVHIEICEILTQFKLVGIGYGVTVAAFNEWRNRARDFYHPDPYFFCLSHLLRKAIMGITEHPRDTGIEIICDAESKNAPVGREIAAWRTERLRRTPIVSPQLAQPDRPVSFDYRPSLDCTALQAADVFAHGVFQFMCNNLQGLTEAKPPSIRDVEAKCPIVFECFFDAEHIAIIQRARIRGDD
jgi:hypothetical protein